MNLKDLSNEELQEKMDTQARAAMSGDGIAQLFIYNLENFAYRYLETSTDQGIKCSFNNNDFFVESTEPNVLNALKWDNPELKKKLIDLCKSHPGKKSADIKIFLKLGSKKVSSNNVICYASVKWSHPETDYIQTLEEKEVKINFKDPLELRNTHAKYLEEVAVIF